MMNTLLVNQIEYLRKELNHMGANENLDSDEVVVMSQKLDKLIVQFHKKNDCRKIS